MIKEVDTILNDIEKGIEKKKEIIRLVTRPMAERINKGWLTK